MASGQYFDFSPVKPWAGGLGDGLESLGNAFEYRDKKRLQDATLELDRVKAANFKAQTEATNRKLSRDEFRDNIKFQQDQSAVRERRVKDIAAAAGGGRFGEAQSIADASQFPDPRTGIMQGIGFTKDQQGPEPTMPEKPNLPTPVQPSFVGPVEPPEVARTRAMAEAMGHRTQPAAPGSSEELLGQAAGAQAEGQSQRVLDERKQFADQNTANDLSQREYDTKVAGWKKESATYADEKAHPKFTITQPGGQTTHYDPREAELAKDEAIREQVKALRDKAVEFGTNSGVGAQYLTVANTLEAKLNGQGTAALTSAVAQDTGNKFKGGEGDKNRTNAVTVAKIRAQAKGHGGGFGGDLPTVADQRVLKEVDDALAENTRKGGLRENLTHSEGTLRTLAPKGPTGPLSENPTDWVNAIDAAIRTNTGRAAILSQYKLYTGKAAGLDDTAEQLWAGFSGANLSPTQKGNLFQSFLHGNSELRRESKINYDKMAAYKTDPRVSGHRAIQLGYNARMNNTFGGMPGFGGQPGAADAQGPAAAPAPAPKPAAAHAPGETKVVGGVTYQKVGPNKWEKAAP